MAIECNLMFVIEIATGTILRADVDQAWVCSPPDFPDLSKQAWRNVRTAYADSSRLAKWRSACPPSLILIDWRLWSLASDQSLQRRLVEEGGE